MPDDAMTTEELAAHHQAAERIEREVETITTNRPLSTGAVLKAIALLGLLDNQERRHELADSVLLAAIDDPQIERAFTTLPKW